LLVTLYNGSGLLVTLYSGSGLLVTLYSGSGLLVTLYQQHACNRDSSQLCGVAVLHMSQRF
jgi:hypothetical protein